MSTWQDWQALRNDLAPHGFAETFISRTDDCDAKFWLHVKDGEGRTKYTVLAKAYDLKQFGGPYISLELEATFHVESVYPDEDYANVRVTRGATGTPIENILACFERIWNTFDLLPHHSRND